MPPFDFITDEAVRTQAIAAHEASIAEITSGVDLKINEAIDGLRTKNQELLDEKKQIQKTLKNFDNIDPTAAREALKFLEENEDAQLIKDGKINDLLDKRTSQLKSDHEAALNELMMKFDTEKSTNASYKALFESKVIDDSLREAAILAKVRPEAISDVLLRGRDVFSLGPDKSVEAREGDKLRKTEDGRVLTPTLYIESLKKVSPHYWPNSEGAGAHGGLTGDPSDRTAALNRAAASGDMALFRKLRDAK